MIISFANDYSEGCHPDILSAIANTNLVQREGYGTDEQCTEARALIRERIGNPQAGVYFVTGGTQANAIVISAMLRPHESVIACTSGHISVHEAGAIEATGHKINTIEADNGKIRPNDILRVLDEHTTIPHMVKPRMVYISNTTEMGTIYALSELKELSDLCHSRGLLLFLDGARLGTALYAPANDIEWAHLAQLTDVFYVGGTKNGALFGEAIVINKPELAVEFDFHIKQRGGLMAKGWLLGQQFATLMRTDLYGRLATHANQMAAQLAAGIEAKGYSLLFPCQANMVYPVFPDKLVESLALHFAFYPHNHPAPGSTSIRLVTSWATTKAQIDSFLAVI